MQTGPVLNPISLLLSGLLVLAGICFGMRAALAQDCPLHAGVTPPPVPDVTAQQVEAGSATLMEFSLAVREQYGQTITGPEDLANRHYLGCLLRQEGGLYRFGLTYIVQLFGDRIFFHSTTQALAGRRLDPLIYNEILHALGVDPAVLGDPAAVAAAFAAAAAGTGGYFNVPGAPGASGYATTYHSPGLREAGVLLAGFDLKPAHLAQEDFDHVAPSVAAKDVVDRATLKAFVTEAGEYYLKLRGTGDLAAAARTNAVLRDPHGPWRHGSVYLAVLDPDSRLIILHGGFPDRFELRPSGIATDAATGERVVDQLIRAAYSSPEGGFWQYYFDNPADDADSVDVPKVGYARVVTTDLSLPNGIVITKDYIVNSGFYLSPGAVELRGVLENPGPHSFQSGVSALWGWVCDAAMVEIEIETAQGEVAPYLAAYGMERLDTQEICGDTDNGFVLLFNWNLLGDGDHLVTALVDGLELGRAMVRVTTVGAGAQEEFLAGAMGECVVEDFPHLGQSTRLEWQQNSQNFVITGVQ